VGDGDGAGPRRRRPALAVGVGERPMRGAPRAAVLGQAVSAGQHEAEALLRRRGAREAAGALLHGAGGRGRASPRVHVHFGSEARLMTRVLHVPDAAAAWSDWDSPSLGAWGG